MSHAQVQADVAFNEHFDGCETCKRAFRLNDTMNGLCDEGVVLCDKTFETRDASVIAAFTEQQVRHELSLGGLDSKLGALTKKRLEARLVALGVKP